MLNALAQCMSQSIDNAKQVQIERVITAMRLSMAMYGINQSLSSYMHCPARIARIILNRFDWVDLYRAEQAVLSNDWESSEPIMDLEYMYGLRYLNSKREGLK